MKQIVKTLTLKKMCVSYSFRMQGCLLEISSANVEFQCFVGSYSFVSWRVSNMMVAILSVFCLFDVTCDHQGTSRYIHQRTIGLLDDDWIYYWVHSPLLPILGKKWNFTMPHDSVWVNYMILYTVNYIYIYKYKKSQKHLDMQIFKFFNNT